MDDCVIPIAVEQLLFDQIHMRNFGRKLLDVAVILNIKAVRNHQIGDRRSRIHIRGCNPNLHLAVLHTCFSFPYCKSKSFASLFKGCGFQRQSLWPLRACSGTLSPVKPLPAAFPRYSIQQSRLFFKSKKEAAGGSDCLEPIFTTIRHRLSGSFAHPASPDDEYRFLFHCILELVEKAAALFVVFLG